MIEQIAIPQSNVAIASSLGRQASDYASHSKSANTVRSYRSDWKHFENWCGQSELNPLPALPSTVGLYLTAHAELHTISTLRRRLTTIQEAHRAAGWKIVFLSDPMLSAIWKGIKRSKGVAQHGKQALLTGDIRLILSNSLGTETETRDRALILLGFAGAFRRSELVSLNIEDLRFTSNGVEILVKRSKTDQLGEGVLKAIPLGSAPELSPVRALEAWIALLGRQAGPLFVSIAKGGRIAEQRLSDRSVALIIKKRLLSAGLDPADFSGHSLRSGFATQAALNGASDRSIMNQTGHRSRQMVDRYVRRVSVWQDNAVTRLGL
jgi:site-specific recombinase XerD